jgi:CHAD domain-containing protein
MTRAVRLLATLGSAESLQDAFRRIAADQLDRAAETLRRVELTAEERVHEARKRFKESRALLRLYRRMYGDSVAVEELLRGFAAEIDAARERMTDLRLNDVGSAVRKGFARTLAAARKAMTDAFETRDDAAVREWRKRVKDHWYHVSCSSPYGLR